MVRTPPGSLSEGAGSPQGLTEGVSSDGCFGPMVYSQVFIGSEIFERLRSSEYTPSASLRSAAPSEREPGGRTPFTRLLAKIQRCGRFSSPLRNSKDFTFHHSSGYTPSVSFAASSLKEGAGERSHSTGYSLNREVTGDFHRPYEGSKDFTFHHSSGDTPSVSHSLDSSLREGAGKRSHSTCRSETARLRAIFIAPTKRKEFDILPLIVLHPPPRGWGGG